MKAEMKMNDLITWYLDTNHLLHNLNARSGSISFEKYIILQKLFEKKVSTITEIAIQMSTTSAAASRKVTELARAGFVEKKHGKPDDQRIVNLYLTPEGIVKYKELTDHYNNISVTQNEVVFR